ncbi:hypothetical protein WN55_06593 [Dufourea novaeangliae]|uniref:Uncharacterized protein n=1 Tax=Dufourea novaeangliae TaxID=178035 RepID=A0A154PQK0_DUFNO|nr:hypothetical protein WN55_06593 [Dufourea novaeangliae]
MQEYWRSSTKDSETNQFFTMSATYATRFEAEFLYTHSRGPKLSYAAAARSMQTLVAFVKKWVK